MPEAEAQRAPPAPDGHLLPSAAISMEVIAFAKRLAKR